MHIYIYTYIYTYIYIYMSVYTYVYIQIGLNSLHVRIYTKYIRTYTFEFVYFHTYRYLPVCFFELVCVGLCLDLWVCVYIYRFVHMYMRLWRFFAEVQYFEVHGAYAGVCVCAFVCVCTCVCVRVLVYV